MFIFLENNISVDIYYAFLDYGPLTRNNYKVHRSIMQFARLDDLVVTVLACLEQREKRGGLRKKLYADKLTCYVREAINHVIK